MPDLNVSYDQLVALTARLMEAREFDSARRVAEHAIASVRDRPEAYNLLGVLQEIAGRRLEAQQLYRIALELQPRFQAAQHNLHRSTQPPGTVRGRMRW